MELVCIKCPRGCNLSIDEKSYNVTGNLCPRGVNYAKAELVMPLRTLTALVKYSFSDYYVPVKTSGEIPKDKIGEVLEFLKDVRTRVGVDIGEVVVPDILGLGVDIVVTGEAYYM